MDRNGFDALVRTIGHSRRAVVAGLLVAGGVGGGVGSTAGKGGGGKRRRRRRSRRITLCYQGETIRVNPSLKRLYPGATQGPCECSTCEAAGKTCGPIDDVCGGTLSCGTCGVGEQNSCHGGVCDTCAATCPQECLICSNLVDGSTVCSGDSATDCASPCTTDADCPEKYPTCLSGEAYRPNNDSRSWPKDCNVDAPGVCSKLLPC